MPRLTKKFIESEISQPIHGQVIFRDSDLTGFGLRVTRGSKSFIAECRVNGVNRRITIGRYGLLSPDQARKKARQLLGLMTAGVDPRSGQTKSKEPGVSLLEVLDQYLATRKLRPNTIRTYTHIFRRCLADWRDLPVTQVTKQMVETRHRELTRETKQNEKRADPDRRAVATVLGNLGQTFLAEGKPEEAEKALLRGWNIAKELVGPTDPYIAIHLDNLGGLYYVQGKLAQSETFERKALAIREKALGQNNPKVAQCLSNLAVVLDSRGKYAEAVTLLKSALEIHKRHSDRRAQTWCRQ